MDWKQLEKESRTRYLTADEWKKIKEGREEEKRTNFLNYLSNLNAQEEKEINELNKGLVKRLEEEHKQKEKEFERKLKEEARKKEEELKKQYRKEYSNLKFAEDPTREAMRSMLHSMFGEE